MGILILKFNTIFSKRSCHRNSTHYSLDTEGPERTLLPREVLVILMSVAHSDRRPGAPQTPHTGTVTHP